MVPENPSLTTVSAESSAGVSKPALPRASRGRRFLLFAGIALVFVLAGSEVGGAAQDGIESLVHEILVETLPREYEDDDKWGKTVRIFNGLKFKGQGLRIRVEQQKKSVNHGLWEYYRIRLIEPEKTFQFDIQNTRHLGNNRFAFRIWLSARMNALARFAQWTNGIRVFGVDADADATIEVTLDCEMKLHLRGSWYLPDLFVEPTVTAGTIRLTELHLHRFGDLHGRFANEIGDGLRRSFDRLLQKHGNIERHANRAIQKQINKGKLTFSSKQVFESKWRGVLGSLSTSNGGHAPPTSSPPANRPAPTAPPTAVVGPQVPVLTAPSITAALPPLPSSDTHTAQYRTIDVLRRLNADAALRPE